MLKEEIINKIKKIRGTSSGNLAKSFYKNKEDLDIIIKITNFLHKNTSLRDRFYYIRNDLFEIKKCKWCNSEINNPINDFCSQKCNINYQIKNTDIVKRRSKTISNVYRNKSEEEKKNIKEKRKNTNQERYNVTNNLNIPEIKKKRIETWIKNLGVDNPMKNEKIRKKTEKTNLEKYGHVTPLFAKEQIKLKKSTWIKNWGVDNPMKNEKIKQKAKNTYKIKTGFDNPMLNPAHVNKLRETWAKNEGLGKHKGGYKYKIYNFLSGKKIFIQGYKGKALDNYLLKIYNENDINNNIKLINSFNFEYINENNQSSSGITRRYIPDFYIQKDKLFIEIKSEYFYYKDIENIYHKSKSVVEKGYNYYILVSRDGNKFIKKEYEKIKIDFEKRNKK